MKKLVMVVLCSLVLFACNQQQSSSVGTPFLGGTQGLAIQFLPDSPPQEVFDGGVYPFSAVIKLQNYGEYPVPREKVRITLEGIRPEDFGQTAASFKKNPPEDPVPRRKEPQTGNLIESTPVFIEFNNLNHGQPIVGSGLTFPVRAEVCYNYGSQATTNLCSRSNILNPTKAGVCLIDEVKPVANAGSPVQVSELREVARAADKIGFTFKLQHSGTGKIFQPEFDCDKTLTVRTHENKVKVKVQSKVPGLVCNSLSGGTEGFVTLFDNTATVTCTQQISSPTDFVFPVEILANFDYEDATTTAITVKRSQ